MPIVTGKPLTGLFLQMTENGGFIFNYTVSTMM